NRQEHNPQGTSLICIRRETRLLLDLDDCKNAVETPRGSKDSTRE
ncbi:unnamed protein product, partial [Arabidopsis halleri]